MGSTRTRGSTSKDPNELVHWADTTGRALWYLVGDSGLALIDDSATAQFAALNQTAATRLGAIRSSHLALSQSLEKFFEGQAALEGELYDLYSSFKTLAGPAMPSAYTSRLTQLAQDLTTPTLNAVYATPIPTGAMTFAGGLKGISFAPGSPYYAEVQFTWTGQHPSGTDEFLYDVAGGAGAGLGASSTLLSNGTSGTWTSYLWTPDRANGGTVDSTFQAGVRGGAGYVGYGEANYSVAFSPGGSAPAAATGGSQDLVSSQPPPSPLVTFPDNPRVAGTTGPRVWTGDSSSIFAQWSSSEPVSGIASYQYAVSAVRTAPASPTDWVTVGGRTTVTIGQQKFSATRPYYVLAKATNGVGVVSGVGSSPPIYYDRHAAGLARLGRCLRQAARVVQRVRGPSDTGCLPGTVAALPGRAQLPATRAQPVRLERRPGWLGLRERDGWRSATAGHVLLAFRHGSRVRRHGVLLAGGFDAHDRLPRTGMERGNGLLSRLTYPAHPSTTRTRSTSPSSP